MPTREPDIFEILDIGQPCRLLVGYLERRSSIARMMSTSLSAST